jgi:hypothetical protein
MENCDVGRGDFLEFLELFFNGEMWHGIRYCGMHLEFQDYFSIEKGDFLEFLELFLIEKGDVACYLNFQNYFSMEKGDMAWGDFLEFLELFFIGERWCDIRWCGMLLVFLENF